MPMRFGKYTLLKKLAKGGMAELFLAIQRSVAGFEKLIVIKRILPEMNQDRAFIEMLLHEARIAATLSHPNIVQIFDVGQELGQYFIAMEHVHGEDLRSIVRQMKKKALLEFPPEHALCITLGVCAGLAYAHERKELDGSDLHIVHRDISPQNIVVTFSGDVKIVDFGIAKSDSKTGEATKSGKLKGKVPYMSPEQARGEHIDHRSDIFSTGVMLFELTTGKRLFKGASEYDTLKMICEEDYPRPSRVRPGYPPGLEAIVMKALEKDRERRYQNAREMQADIEAFIRDQRIAVSNIALNQFMQSLFEEKLAAQKEALLQGKQLADIIETQRNIEGTMEFPGAAQILAAQGQSLPGMGMQVSNSQSMPAAAHTVTNFSAQPQRANVGLFVGLALAGLLVVGTLSAVLIVKRQRNIANALGHDALQAPQQAMSQGALEVTSDPAGASIWVNGDLRRETTPATIPLPIGGAVDVKITKDGFEPQKSSVVLTDAKPHDSLAFSLKKGSVVVDVTVKPDDAHATMTLDGKPFSGSVDGVASGIEHKVVITAPGFLDQTMTFIGDPMERKHMDVLLAKPLAVEPTPRPNRGGGSRQDPAPVVTSAGNASPPPQPQGTGKLNVGASGGWCNVTVDGVPRGATPVAGLEMSSGPHRVTCTPEGGKAQSAVVNVPADGTARYKFSL
jgi:serine/threonine-protein kinase